MQTNEVFSITFSDMTEQKAKEIAELLNMGMQDKAKALGFHYVVVKQTPTAFVKKVKP